MFLILMESNEPIYSTPTPDPASTNKHSIISLVLGVLTVILFCGSFLIPIPFTSLICLPVSFLLGLSALIYGTVSLNRIRKNNEAGSVMAWIGIFSGGFIFLCMICMVVAIAALFYFSPDTIQPVIEGYQL